MCDPRYFGAFSPMYWKRTNLQVWLSPDQFDSLLPPHDKYLKFGDPPQYFVVKCNPSSTYLVVHPPVILEASLIMILQ